MRSRVIVRCAVLSLSSLALLAACSNLPGASSTLPSVSASDSVSSLPTSPSTSTPPRFI